MRLARFVVEVIGALTVLVAMPGYADHSGHVQKAERPLLLEDWQTVDKQYEDCDPNAVPSSAVWRAIMGHASLAVNSNDKSLGLLLSLANEPNRVAWNQWTLDFASAHRTSAAALYLKGDALARTGDWTKAVDVYTLCLSQAKTATMKAMVLNARGVALASLGDFNKARDDIEAAIGTAPKFADAYANLGTLKVLREAPDTAIEDYDRAIARSVAFALARNGRACARIGYSRDPNSVQQALSDYLSAKTCPPVRALAEANILAVSRIIGEGEDYGMKNSEGTTLSANQFRFMDSRSQQSIMARMPKEDLVNIADRAYKNYMHSKTWGEALQYLRADTLNLPFMDAKQSLRHADEHMAVFNSAKTMLQQRDNIRLGFDPAGGARTAELEKGYADRGNWPVKTWFGLAQQVSVPAQRQEKPPIGVTTP